MSCHVCQAEAVTRCYQCGELVCAAHNRNDICSHCNSGFAEGNPGSRISAEPLGRAQAPHGWWRPQEAEEYQPPACYQCKGLTRAVCRNCQANYCPDHAGPNNLCRDCGRSANLGLYIVGGMLALVLAMLIGNWLFG